MDGNAGYYGFCGPTQTLMFKCFDDDNELFNPATNKCEYNCRAEKIYPDQTNCIGYISCARLHGKMIATKMNCTTNFHYDDVAQKCVRGNCESAITVPPPPTTKK